MKFTNIREHALLSRRARGSAMAALTAVFDAVRVRRARFAIRVPQAIEGALIVGALIVGAVLSIGGLGFEVATSGM